MDWFGRLISTDFDELRQAFAEWDHEYDQIAPGPFRGEMTFGQFGTMQVSRVSWHNRIRYRGQTPPDSFALALTLTRRGHGRRMGERVGRDDVLLQRPGREAEFVAPHAWDAFVVSIPRAEFLKYSRAYFRTASDDLDLFHGLAKLGSRQAGLLRQEVRLYCDVLEAACSGRDTSEEDIRALGRISRQIVRDVCGTILSRERCEIAPPNSRRDRALVMDAEAYVRSQSNRNVGILELCEVLAVSERTLHYAFQRNVGRSPASWIRTIRLNRVRRQLRGSDSAFRLVKSVAIENGFCHLSRFAATYRAQFGELPSDTVRLRTSGYARGAGTPLSVVR